MDSTVDSEKLLKDAQVFIALGAYEDASKKYQQIINLDPSDPRGWMGFVRLAIEHQTTLCIEGIQLDPVRGVLKFSDNDFLYWFYKNIGKDKRIVDNCLTYMREVGSEPGDGDKALIDSMNKLYEEKCHRIRSGESSIEAELGEGEWDGAWDGLKRQYRGELRLNCDHIQCVRELLNEAKNNDSYFKQKVKQIGDEVYKKEAEGVIYRLWQPKWSSRYSDYSGPMSRSLPSEDGGLIGKEYYHGTDRDHGLVSEYYDLKLVVTEKEIDILFQEMVRCYNQRLCPYCGIGRKRILTEKCSNCGRHL